MRNVAPVTLTLPPELIERASRIAAAEARSRSFVVARALQVYCDANEIPPGGLADDEADLAAGARAPSGSPAAPLPGGFLEVAPPQPAAKCGTDAGRFPTSDLYSNVHVDALRRVHARHTERAEIARQHRERVLRETTESMKGTTE